MRRLRELGARNQAIQHDKGLTTEERYNRIQELTLDNPPVKLEDLG